MLHEREQSPTGLASACNNIIFHEKYLFIRFAESRYLALRQGWSYLQDHGQHECKASSDLLLDTRKCPEHLMCTARLADRSLAWSILNLHVINEAFSLEEHELVVAYTSNKLDVTSLQTALVKARHDDTETLLFTFKSLMNLDDSELISRLQENQYGQPHQVKELATAFAMHARRSTENFDNNRLDMDPFLRVVISALQRHTCRPADYEVPLWCVTSFDVHFDIDDSRLIGQGAFGRVVEGIWNGKLVAVKEFVPEVGDRYTTDAIRHEVHVWSRLSHPNILSFYGASFEATKPFIVSELCKAGNALKYIHECQHVDLIKLLYDVSLGMAYLHEQGVIHADLKASNILIRDNKTALIADFGLSQIRDQVSSSVNVTRTSAEKAGGTYRWMAPEVLEGKSINKPADIYGFALVAWEFFTNGSVPFGSITDTKQFFSHVLNGGRPERPVEVDDSMWKLIERCWVHDPSERPDFVEVRQTLAQLEIHGSDNQTASAQPSPRVGKMIVETLRQSSGPQEKSSTWAFVRRRSSASNGTAGGKAKISSIRKLSSNLGIFISSPKSSQSPTRALKSPKGHGANIDNCENGLKVRITIQGLRSFSRTLTPSSEPVPIDIMLTFLHDLSLKAEGVSEILSEEGLVSGIVNRLACSEPALENERYLSFGFLANLACHKSGRAAIIAEPKLTYALRISLAPQNSSAVLENTTRCLYNLLTDDHSHQLLASATEIISFLGILLNRMASPAVVKSTLGCFTNLSHKEPGRSSILQTGDVLDALIHVLESNSGEDITEEQALMCIGNLSVDEKGLEILITCAKLVPALSRCLCAENSTPATKAQVLRCLRNLAKSSGSHAAIDACPDILSSVCEVLAARASSNQQKYALHFVYRFALSSVGRERLQCETRVASALRWFAEHGSSEDQKRASACLGIIAQNGVYP